MDELFDFLVIIAERLGRAHIAYMLGGSVAFSVYVQPRMTRDVDFVIEIEDSQVDRFDLQLGDVRNLILSEHTLDWPYIVRWAQNMNRPRSEQSDSWQLRRLGLDRTGMLTTTSSRCAR